LWSQQTAARLAGLAWAREPECALAWDVGGRVYLWDRLGRRVAEHALLTPPAAMAISDDGRNIVAGSQSGQLFWFNERLELQFDRALGLAVQAAALETRGDYLAISDSHRRTRLLTRNGEELACIQTPRPLKFLAFVPARAALIGAADYGFVGGFDAQGRCLWRDAPPTHCGGLACDGSGERVLLAGYSDGIRTYLAGKRQAHLRTPSPCALVACDFEGRRLVAAGEDGSLTLLKAGGAVLENHTLSRRLNALALNALGEVAICGMPDGGIAAIRLDGQRD
jgi:hypothetical protein